VSRTECKIEASSVSGNSVVTASYFVTVCGLEIVTALSADPMVLVLPQMTSHSITLSTFASKFTVDFTQSDSLCNIFKLNLFNYPQNKNEYVA